MCDQHRIMLITSPSTYVYGTCFITFSVVASLVNITALYILLTSRTNGMISKSAKILTSLAVSDVLTGVIGFPTSAYQILSDNSCDKDSVRTVMSLVLTGSSNLTLALIAFDRYLLMTKFTKYDNLMTNRVLALLISLCWLYPILTIALRYAPSPYPYLASLVFIFYGPIIFIMVFYFLLVREIYRSEKNLKQHGQRHIITPSIIHSPVVSRSTVGSSTVAVKTPLPDAHSKRTEKRHLRTARAVTWLLVCYSLCMAPFNLWIVFNIMNNQHSLMSRKTLQEWYIFGVTVAGWNSCFNPFVYLTKQPNARKRLRNVFCVFRNNKQKNRIVPSVAGTMVGFRNEQTHTDNI